MAITHVESCERVDLSDEIKRWNEWQVNIARRLAAVLVILMIGGIVGSIVIGAAIGLYLSPPGGIHESVVAYMTEVMQFSLVLASFAVPVSVGVGIPAYLLLKRIGLLCWWSVTAIGALAGGVVGLITVAGYTPLALCVGLGLSAAIIAWVLLSRFALTT